MIEIKDLLARFNNILLTGEAQKDTVRNIISETIGVKIKSDDIKIKNGTVYLNIKPLYKSEIFLKKDKIAQKLEIAIGKKAPQEFR